MRIEENEIFEKYTTFKMGGHCERVYFPENQEDLITVMKMDPGSFEHVIGCGSNILVSRNIDLKGAICSKNYFEGFKNYGGGKFYFPSGYLLGDVINIINEQGYGGIEYLYSVPGTIGGAILMNAGRGKVYGLSISDFIQYVDVYIDGKVERLEKKYCGFDYRKSNFQRMKNIFIIGAKFLFNKCDAEESKRLKIERLEFCSATQDLSAPNMGSVFSEYDPDILDFVQKKIDMKLNVRYSDKTRNWLLNEGGTFEETMYLINCVKIIHDLLDKNLELEIRIWEE